MVGTVVICRDQTANEERDARAVEACRGHGGVAAFDDDIAICRDQTFQEVGRGDRAQTAVAAAGAGTGGNGPRRRAQRVRSRFNARS
jgi:hypothetical protein